MIGYWLAQALHNAGVCKPIPCLVTQTLVDSADPAFAGPAKFIGPVYAKRTAEGPAEQHGWAIAADGNQWRPVVASPEPQRIIEQDSVTALLDGGAVVICGGGGGAAVTEDADGRLTGVAVGAQRLLVLTDVAAVMQDYGTPKAVALTSLDVNELGNMQFSAGSMGPKIEACRRFVTATGLPATIGTLADAQALFAGAAGTTITGTRDLLTTSRRG